MVKKKFLLGMTALLLSFGLALTGCGRDDDNGSLSLEYVEATGPFWATQWVNNADSAITLEVGFDGDNVIRAIRYTPVPAHVTNNSGNAPSTSREDNYFVRWFTAGEGGAGNFQSYIDALIDMPASEVAAFDPSLTTAPLNGNLNITGFDVTIVSGASQTARNLVAAVSAAARKRLVLGPWERPDEGPVTLDNVEAVGDEITGTTALILTFSGNPGTGLSAADIVITPAAAVERGALSGSGIERTLHITAVLTPVEVTVSINPDRDIEDGASGPFTVTLLERDDSVPPPMEIEARGSFWAWDFVNNQTAEITLTVKFERDSGQIVDIDYTPAPNHTYGGTPWETEWAANWRRYVTALREFTAEQIAGWTRPPNTEPSNGAHGIVGLPNVITGATETGRNFVSSVVAAAKIFMEGGGNDLPSYGSAFVQATAAGSFWADQHVNTAAHQIDVTVVFDTATGKIAHIAYAPLLSHTTNNDNTGNYWVRWIGTDGFTTGGGNPVTHPAPTANYRTYINALVGMDARIVAAFEPPTASPAGGNTQIAAFPVNIVSGATQTAVNLISSVVEASKRYTAGSADVSTWTAGTVLRAPIPAIADTVSVEATGAFWADQYVNSAAYQITLNVIIGTGGARAGRIIGVDYAPVSGHTTAANYWTRWTTVEDSRPAYFQTYINQLIGRLASDVAAFEPPTDRPANGNTQITALPVNIVSGATQTGVNLISSVVEAAKTFTEDGE